MVRWVPSCMVLWGIATALHVWIRERWQLYTLRVAIGILEGKGGEKWVVDRADPVS